MKRRPLGKTGMQVSEISFGGVEIGMPYGIGVQSVDDMIAEEDAIRLLHASLDAGINFYDTARQYGKSEAIIGRAFKGRRSDVIICTKCSHFLQADESVPPYPSLKNVMETSLRQSLEALHTDYVDVLMLHEGNMNILNDEGVRRILTDMKKTGMIRATGVSTYEPEETLKAVESEVFDVIQLPFNLLDQRQASLFPLASDMGIGIVARSVLMKGVLSGRGKDLHQALKDVEEHIRKYDPLVNGSVSDVSMLAQRFVLSFQEISSILIGLDRIEYLQESIAAADDGYLDEETLSRAKLLAYPDPAFLNLQRWSRSGWLR